MTKNKLPSPLKLHEIASRINAHLKLFDAYEAHIQRKIAVPSLFYCAAAWESGNYVGVRYISYKGDVMLTKGDAQEYLAWLDEGNVGRHYDMPKWKRVIEARRAANAE